MRHTARIPFLNLMFAKSKSKKAAAVLHDEVSMAMGVFLWVIGVLTTVIAVIGVYKAHVLSTGLTFGTLSCSASLVALTLNLFLLKKVLDCWMDGSKK